MSSIKVHQYEGKMVEIIIGSQMGSAEYVAEQIAEHLIEQGISVNLHENPILSDCQNPVWLIITSTYGAGDYPDNLIPFINDVSEHSELDHIRFSVIGLGDKSYDTYNYAAKNCSELLISKHAKQLIPRLEINVLDEALPEETAIEWLPNFIEKLTNT